VFPEPGSRVVRAELSEVALPALQVSLRYVISDLWGATVAAGGDSQKRERQRLSGSGVEAKRRVI